jgi:hypothetical protein
MKIPVLGSLDNHEPQKRRKKRNLIPNFQQRLAFFGDCRYPPFQEFVALRA